MTQLDAFNADKEWEYRSGFTVAPSFLESLEDQIMGATRSGKQTSLGSATNWHTEFLRRRFLLTSSQAQKAGVLQSRTTVPPVSVAKEPVDGAWLKEGDILEGMLRCKVQGTCKWHTRDVHR